MNKTREEMVQAYEKQRHREKISSYFENSGVPKRFKNKTLHDINLKDKEMSQAVKSISGYIKTLKDRILSGSSGFFCGNCGTGKTMLACIIVEEACRQGHGAIYTTAWNMIQTIRQGYQPGNFVGVYVQSYINKPLLVIDEIGVQRGTEDERVLLYQVIDGRYNEVRPTILISNSKNPVEDGYIDLRTIDRLKEGGGFSITFNGDSYRR